MQLPKSTLICCVFIICLTLLIFIYLTRNSFCEFEYKNGKKEIKAFITHESGR